MTMYFSCIGVCVCMGVVSVLMCFKEELAWAIDKWPWVIKIS